MPKEQFPPMPEYPPEPAPNMEGIPRLDDDVKDVAYSDEEEEWKPPEQKEIGGLEYEVSDGNMNFGFNFNIGFSNEKTPEELQALKQKLGISPFPGTETVDLRDLIVAEGGVRHDAGGDLLCLPSGAQLEATDDVYFTLPKSQIRCKIDMHGSSRLKNVSEA